ncbi:hypothetical protein EPA93_17375 [Ktedonosporobacter rubrisoli]|uniref:Uncharacterized protein n=1 Tax=Ktedonosporobacter rubrisoli TaxID=2509675 RepID=A0A4P6JS54_KTERU|nr:hypothetical protein [Ktedonosporobacter rubrisoli]QBD77666.1 hypothetical protein EPA93_17375 [Ktedonosporobacter rubrisoli]
MLSYLGDEMIATSFGLSPFVPRRPNYAVAYVVVDTCDDFIGYETGSAAFSRLSALACLERAHTH